MGGHYGVIPTRSWPAVTVTGWAMLTLGGFMAVIPGMFGVVNGATVWGVLLAVGGAGVLLTRKGAEHGES